MQELINVKLLSPRFLTRSIMAHFLHFHEIIILYIYTSTMRQQNRHDMSDSTPLKVCTNFNFVTKALKFLHTAYTYVAIYFLII